MAKHALLSPSGAERWMTCAASIAISEGLPDSSSAYADEGTAAHFLGEQCLKLNKLPVFYLGRSIVIWSHPESDSSGCGWLQDLAESKEVGLLDMNEFEVDDVMVRHVTTYVENVRGYAEGNEIMVECKVPIGAYTGEEGATGTADDIILAPKELQIHDLKYGMGERVDAERNKQEMLYALGALEEQDLLGDIETVLLVIHQPRLDHLSEWRCTVEELRAFGEEVKAAAVVVWHARAHKSNWESDAKAVFYAPGEKACRWCKAKANCRALSAYVVDVIGESFEDLTEEIVVTGDLSTKMRAVGLVEIWCKAVRAQVEADLFDGTPVEGFKLVQGKKGNRSWADEKAAEEMLKTMRVKHDAMYSYKLISPTRAEELAKEKVIGERQWPKLKAMITQADGKPSVAPESDKRPALKPIEDEFDNLEEDLI